jgi:hypothetical protein
MITETIQEDNDSLSRALLKSCSDYFDYALKLRTGEVIRFRSATLLNKEWIHLEIEDAERNTEFALPYKADRGIDVRLSDIVWVMDAPEGS